MGRSQNSDGYIGLFERIYNTKMKISNLIDVSLVEIS